MRVLKQQAAPSWFLDWKQYLSWHFLCFLIKIPTNTSTSLWASLTKQSLTAGIINIILEVGLIVWRGILRLPRSRLNSNFVISANSAAFPKERMPCVYSWAPVSIFNWRCCSLRGIRLHAPQCQVFYQDGHNLPLSSVKRRQIHMICISQIRFDLCVQRRFLIRMFLRLFMDKQSAYLTQKNIRSKCRARGYMNPLIESTSLPLKCTTSIGFCRQAGHKSPS